MNILFLTKDTEARAKEIAVYAAKPGNWYRPGETLTLPGEHPEYVLVSGTIRAVFTWTRATKSLVIRHMSVSVQGANYPNPLTVWTLAHMFGFTGAKPDEHGLVHQPANTWGCFVDKDERCVVVQEKIEGVTS